MDDIGPCGVSQCSAPRRPVRPGGAVVGLSGDVDADGEIVDALTRRLAAAVCTDGTVDAGGHVARVRRVVLGRVVH